MRSLALDYDTLTLTLEKPKGALLDAQLALTHQAKNLKNTGLYIIRQVFTAYEYDSITKTSILKSNLHPEQVKAIDSYNLHIASINEKRIAKYPAQCAKAIAAEKEVPTLNLVAPLTQTVSKLANTVLDATTLDNVVRSWKDQNGESIYKRLPGIMAQQVLKRLCESFSSFFAATVRYKESKKDMTGKPRMPNYLQKNERAALEIPLANVYGGFPILKNQHIPADYAETKFLTPEMRKAFAEFDVIAAVENVCKKRGWSDFEPQHLRIVPSRNSVKMEVVVRVRNAYPEKSYMASLISQHGTELAALKNDKKREEWLLKFLNATAFENLPRIASMDLGVNNLISVAYSTGHKAAVHDGGRFEATLTNLGKLIDKRISSITPQRAKELQGKKNVLREQDKKLELTEHIELNSLLKEVYEDFEYRRLTEKKNRWISDYLHKTSHALIQQCRSRGIDVIVIGKNKGWKDEVNMGKKQNRRFCQIAHATLINLIKYKAEMAGMAVATTEESYTSKTSFINGDILDNFEVRESLKSVGKPAPKAAKSGYRSSSNRNMFVHKNRNDRWRRVHADVNGAFNIIRKVFLSFSYHAGLTLKYTLYRISPRRGLVQVNTA